MGLYHTINSELRRSVQLGFKRKHSIATTLSTWKVMDISLNMSTAVKTGLSTLEIPHADPGSPLGAGMSADLDFALCCSGPGWFWKFSKLFYTASNPQTRTPRELPKKGGVHLLLILGWVKCLLKCQSLSIDFRDIQGDHVNLWFHIYSFKLTQVQMLPLLPLQ